MAARARRRLSPDALAYLETGAGRETTLRANRRAWDKVALRPRVLRDVRVVDPSTTILNTPVSLPVGIAPVGYQRLFHPRGEAATAAAAAERGALLMLSTRCSMPLADVAAAGGPLWFQVYVLRDRGLTVEMAREAARLGARALVITVDTPVPGSKRRCPDLSMLDEVLAVPAERSRRERITQAADVTPDTIGWLASTTGLPVGVKGVLHPDDARIAVRAGAAVVIVSNHGGRQLDGAVASAVALPAVVDAVGDQVPVLVDGGIRHGSDVLRALALGARGVLVGRPVIHGLAAAGAEGVAAVLDRFRRELEEVMRLAGADRIDAIGRDLLVTGAS
ncbi:MAG TPA: alpha-hydroxy acid oxidase [Verrucomicrobiae bacterium]|nr:alpha-hydroxy acid oxidase [Verrucomicrobiae bacterium]